MFELALFLPSHFLSPEPPPQPFKIILSILLKSEIEIFKCAKIYQALQNCHHTTFLKNEKH